MQQRLHVIGVEAEGVIVATKGDDMVKVAIGDIYSSTTATGAGTTRVICKP